MSDAFFARPVINSPYECPARHWELEQGQPTQRVIEDRRRAEFVTPIPKPKKRQGSRGSDAQADLGLDDGAGSADGQYELMSLINEVRSLVSRWRAEPDQAQWGVSPETARLLAHWRQHDFAGPRPFFCQIEAVETAIWLTEVAPHTASGRKVLDYLAAANAEANPGLARLALKLATGAGKTTVMAMLIAWQTVNAVRRPGSRLFSRGFLIVAPGLTIRDRLRVLLPSDGENYYATRELVPADMLDDIRRAKIVITNYHAFQLRERVEIAAGTRKFLAGRGPDIITRETPGQMMQRVMPDLMGMKNIVVLNDEAHHCYREKPGDEDDADDDLTGDDRKAAERRREAARVWISGIETVAEKLGVSRVFDLSATPFFLAGSGYREGTLFPWTMSDFSLMDAIECGIVKLPRVPVAENLPGTEMPMYRDLWENIRRDMPKKGRGTAGALDPLKLPARLQTALFALYGHYEKTFALWQQAGIGVPPCFIVVCQNTAISKLVHDYIAGFWQDDADGPRRFTAGRLPLFRNFDDAGEPLARPHTLLIDSEQLESGEILDKNFHEAAAPELARFRREIVERKRDAHAADNLSDADILREVMNTVGKPGTLGGGVRCVVSVSMLTEGWDANTVTHVFGVRAFGTQLLCEQVIGRALRRQSYDLAADGLLPVEYADVFGIPFDFTAKPVVAAPQEPRKITVVKAVSPDRDHLEIRFPRVEGYRTELPAERITAAFTEDSVLTLTPDLVGPTRVLNSGIVGEAADLGLATLTEARPQAIAFQLAKRLAFTAFRDAGDAPKLHLVPHLKRIAAEWLSTCLDCKGGTSPALLEYDQLAAMACERITAAITLAHSATHPVKAILDPYNPTGSTRHVRFTTTRETFDTGPGNRCHLNAAVLDSGWEGEFCRAVEAHPRVQAYVKNHALGFEVPYRTGSVAKRYRPDFLVLVDDGRPDPLHLVVEIKGFRREDVKDKRNAMLGSWIPGVNRLGTHGRWAFAEFRDVWEIESGLAAAITAAVADLVAAAAGGSRA